MGFWNSSNDDCDDYDKAPWRQLEVLHSCPAKSSIRSVEHHHLEQKLWHEKMKRWPLHIRWFKYVWHYHRQDLQRRNVSKLKKNCFWKWKASNQKVGLSNKSWFISFTVLYINGYKFKWHSLSRSLHCGCEGSFWSRSKNCQPTIYLRGHFGSRKVVDLPKQTTGVYDDLFR